MRAHARAPVSGAAVAVLAVGLLSAATVTAQERPAAALGKHPDAARLLGAADAMRQRIGDPRAATQENEIRESFAEARAALDADTWESQYQAGRDTTVEDALTKAHAATCG